MNIILYGINNCDSVKKARQWLAAQAIDYQFIDFKKQAPDENLIRQWLKQIELTQVLNKRSSTWRSLSAAEQVRAADDGGAIALMMQHPSLIKRPILQHSQGITVGFDANIVNSNQSSTTIRSLPS